MVHITCSTARNTDEGVSRGEGGSRPATTPPDVSTWKGRWAPLPLFLPSTVIARLESSLHTPFLPFNISIVFLFFGEPLGFCFVPYSAPYPPYPFFYTILSLLPFPSFNQSLLYCRPGTPLGPVTLLNDIHSLDQVISSKSPSPRPFLTLLPTPVA